MDHIGRYRILAEVGRRPMVVVYHAIDSTIGRSVALKTILTGEIRDREIRTRLRNHLFGQARSAGVLSHPNIVSIYDMDETAEFASIAMAWVNGPTLQKILASEAPLSGANMLGILRQTASALDYAHSRGILHRNLNPANIMTDEDGAVKVTDFGIPKIDAAHSGMESDYVGASPRYMSPEQWQTRPLNGACDQFALALMAYEILTGEQPFAGGILAVDREKVLSSPPPEAHHVNRTLAPVVHDVLCRGLAKEPGDRYANCSSFVGALEMACAESRGWSTLPAAVPVATSPVVTSPVIERIPESGIPRSAPQPRIAKPAGSSLLLPIVMGALVVLGMATTVTWRSGRLSGILPFERNSRVEARAPDSDIGTVQNEPVSDRHPPALAEQRPVEKQSHTRPLEPQQSDIAVSTGEPSLLIAPGVVTQQASPSPQPVRQLQQIVRFTAASTQDVWITTNPPGAQAMLDENMAETCQTPCMMRGFPGLHHLMISLTGYQTEARDVHIGESALTLPVIALRPQSGTVMLATNPSGATVRVNGQLVDQVTPAQLNLGPGNYAITVEKAGRSQTERVDVHESPIYLKIPLNP